MLTVPFTLPHHIPTAVAETREALTGHGVVAVPTETFYGLAVRPDDPEAVRSVFALKRRAEGKALPVVVASFEDLAPLVVVPQGWRDRLRAAWPAPLTVVLPVRARLAGGGDTLAVRVPDHALLRALLAAVGPLTATSANRGGSPPLACPEEVATEFGGEIALLLDGGTTPGGASSTLVELTSRLPRVLRKGAWEPPPEWGVRWG